MDKIDYSKHVKPIKRIECANCVFFEKRTGMYDDGHELGRCLSREYYIKVIDSCTRFKPKN